MGIVVHFISYYNFHLYPKLRNITIEPPKNALMTHPKGGRPYMVCPLEKITFFAASLYNFFFVIEAKSSIKKIKHEWFGVRRCITRPDKRGCVFLVSSKK